jgi:O-antigen biosynthesis protein
MSSIIVFFKSMFSQKAKIALWRVVDFFLRGNKTLEGPTAALHEACFDNEYYIETYADVTESKLTPYEHYTRFGYAEGRKARFFDFAWYTKKYPEISRLGIGGRSHYFTHGKAEGRQARYLEIIPHLLGSERNNYNKWLKLYTPPPTPVPANGPLISIIMPVYNPEPIFLEAAIQSVRRQTYTNWELCITNDASPDPRIRTLLQNFENSDARIKVTELIENGGISAASNAAIAMSGGDYIALLDHDDELTADALSAVVTTILTGPDVDILFSDEDKITAEGDRYDPYFKSDFNYELFLAQNMISHFGVYRSDLVHEVGGFRKAYDGAQDYDLALRIFEKSSPERIRHISQVLYHWRAIPGSTAMDLGEKSYAPDAGMRAVADHLRRKNTPASVELADRRSGHNRVRYALIETAAHVSILIPTRDRVELLRTCVNSILDRTSYPNFDIIVIDNGSVETETAQYLAQLVGPRLKVIRDDNKFNFSALNNLGAKTAMGQYLCLLNNDMEILTPDWLEEMLSFAQQPDIGCVGARLWYPDNSLQHGGVILGIGGVAGHSHKGLGRSATGYFGRGRHHQAFSAVTAACLMVKKSVYDSVDGFDESLAVAFNDVDFCLRVAETGLRNVWTPYAELIHHESATRGEELTSAQQARFSQEVGLMQARWGKRLANDPYYNCNLTLDYEDFSLAWPPRSSGI